MRRGLLTPNNEGPASEYSDCRRCAGQGGGLGRTRGPLGPTSLPDRPTIEKCFLVVPPDHGAPWMAVVGSGQLQHSQARRGVAVRNARIVGHRAKANMQRCMPRIGQRRRERPGRGREWPGGSRRVSQWPVVLAKSRVDFRISFPGSDDHVAVALPAQDFEPGTTWPAAVTKVDGSINAFFRTERGRVTRI